MSKRSVVILASGLLMLGTSMASAETRQAFLTGPQEVPAVSTPGSGTFRADISADETQISWELSYQDLQGTVSAAHIHIAQPDVTGNIVIHFCGTGGKPACPASPATISGVATSADVVAVPSQGIAAGEIGEVIALMRKRAAYVNVHSTPDHGTGEIRGNIR